MIVKVTLSLAKSTANTAYDQLPEGNKEERFLSWALDHEFRDARLSPLGIEQCMSSQPIVNQLKIHTIMVSPLRRTLETAYNVYKTHPNFDKIKFLVVPALRECLNTTSDIPIHIEETIREFRDLIPQLDFSLFDEFEEQATLLLRDYELRSKRSRQITLSSKGW